VEYSSAQSLFAATKAMRDKGEELVAIYHSHPTSEPIPSATDLERNFYGDTVVHFIIGLAGAEPLLRGWRLHEKDFDEAAWRLIEG
jgi:proteasome lid subunit RPN8/RPN11